MSQPMPKELYSAFVAMLAPYRSDLTAADIEAALSAQNDAVPRNILIAAPEVCKMLGLSRVHIARLAIAGELERVNVSALPDSERKAWRYPEASILEYIERRKEA